MWGAGAIYDIWSLFVVGVSGQLTCVYTYMFFFGIHQIKKALGVRMRAVRDVIVVTGHHDDDRHLREIPVAAPSGSTSPLSMPEDHRFSCKMFFFFSAKVAKRAQDPRRSLYKKERHVGMVCYIIMYLSLDLCRVQ